MKQTSPNTQYRPHAFIDYYEHVRFNCFFNTFQEDAKKAKDDMNSNQQIRMLLSDKSCEVLFAIKKRCKDFNNPQMGP